MADGITIDAAALIEAQSQEIARLTYRALVAETALAQAQDALHAAAERGVV